MTSAEPLILIVDDIPTFREIIKDMLSEIGFSNFAEANDGVEALKIIESGVPALVLSDYMMPNLNGVEFLKSFKKMDACNAIPFIMVTAVSEKAVAEEAIANGATELITKPVNFSVLRNAVLKSLSDLMA